MIALLQTSLSGPVTRDHEDVPTDTETKAQVWQAARARAGASHHCATCLHEPPAAFTAGIFIFTTTIVNQILLSYANDVRSYIRSAIADYRADI